LTAPADATSAIELRVARHVEIVELRDGRISHDGQIDGHRHDVRRLEAGIHGVESGEPIVEVDGRFSTAQTRAAHNLREDASDKTGSASQRAGTPRAKGSFCQEDYDCRRVPRRLGKGGIRKRLMTDQEVGDRM
jgi:hypothetical protein